MPGTQDGGKKAALKNTELYGPNFYREIGKIGGSVRHPNKGFGNDKERAREAGRLGGVISRRTKKILTD